jgi:hypothetical protein
MPGAMHTLVQGNYVGVDASGTRAIGNNLGGFLFGYDASNNTIGGVITGSRNVISGNQTTGIIIANSELKNNSIQGNFIGTDKDGIRAIPNTENGILVTQARGTVIGGTDVNARNIISGNGQHGIALGSFTTKPDGSDGVSGGNGVIIRGNYIGTDVTGAQPLGNTLCGIYVEVTCAQHTIENNLIAFNGRDGVCVPDFSSQGNQSAIQINITQNAIFSNSGLGINLGNDGVTENDFQDLDGGANSKQNYPVLGQATTSVTYAVVNGEVIPHATVSIPVTFNSTPNTDFTIEFFYGTAVSADGHQFVNSRPTKLVPPLANAPVTVRTKANGDASFDFTFTIPENRDSGWVNATAINNSPGAGQFNTSEFSACRFVQATAANCSYTMNPMSSSVSAESGTGSFAVTVQNGCTWTAVSSAEWLRTSSSGSGNGPVNYSFTQNTSTQERSATISVGNQVHTVRQAGAAAGPTITSVYREGKHLIVLGSGFQDSAKVFRNGEQIKTTVELSSRLFCKKQGKSTATGNQIQVRNPDGSLSNVVSYPFNPPPTAP